MDVKRPLRPVLRSYGDTRPAILVFSDFFEPAYEAGGVVRALTTSLQLTANDFEYFIVTRDRDLKSAERFAFLLANSENADSPLWHARPAGRVYYSSSIAGALLRLPYFYARIQPQLICLNSIFSLFSVGVLVSRFLGLRAHIPLMIAPRGELAPPALAIKPLRKRIWLAALQMSGVMRTTHWLASSKLEMDDISRSQLRPTAASITVIPEIIEIGATRGTGHQKRAGTLHVCVLGRVAPIKNIDGILRALVAAEGEYSVDVVGPIDDASYFAACAALLDGLGPNVRWVWRGSLSRDEALKQLSKADVLVAPSHSENFGHAIAEALSLGVPVVVSRATPWGGIERQRGGWSITAGDDTELRKTLEAVCRLDEHEYTKVCDAARRFAEERLQPTVSADALSQLMADIIASTHGLQRDRE